jgi:hypothetical protein
MAVIPEVVPNFANPRRLFRAKSWDHGTGITHAVLSPMQLFTQFHVALSLLGIFAGFIFAYALLTSKPFKTWTAIFLWSTLATSLTGFLFPFNGFTPALGFGIISTLVLALSFFSLHVRKLSGAWRWLYVLSTVFAFYLNFFVLIVQVFLKIPAAHALAPTQTEPPFAIAQLLALLAFSALAVAGVLKFKPAPQITP